MITEKIDDEDKENEARTVIDEEGDEAMEMTANDDDEAFETPAAILPEIMSNGRVTCPRSPLVDSK